MRSERFQLLRIVAVAIVAASAYGIIHDLITAHLADGRTISVPLVWSWRLANATPEQRQHFEIIGTGQGVHWPDIDEDLSAIGMLTGTPAPRPKQKA